MHGFLNIYLVCPSYALITEALELHEMLNLCKTW